MAENNTRQPDEISLGEDKDAHGRARGKRKPQRVHRGGGLNLFYLFVICVVLVIVALLVIGVRVSDIFGEGEEGRVCRIEYQLYFSSVDEAFADAIVQGDTFYDADTKAGMGVVAAPVQIKTSAVLVASSASGEGELVLLPGRVDMTVTVTVDALYVEGVGYTVNGRALRLGSSYTLRFPGYVGQGVCVELSEVGAAK